MLDQDMASLRGIFEDNRGDGRCSGERIFFIGLGVCPNSEGF